MDEYGTNDGYDPSGGWGYHEWDAASNEAWANYTTATSQGDTASADHWQQVAETSAQNSHDVYVSGGSAYGTGGDASGYNDGTYYGAGAADYSSAPAADYYGSTADYSSNYVADYSAAGGSDSASMISAESSSIRDVL
jgi:hypothetical protein